MSRVTSRSLEQLGWFACGLRDYRKIPKISPSKCKPPPKQVTRKTLRKSPLQIKISKTKQNTSNDKAQLILKRKFPSVDKSL